MNKIYPNRLIPTMSTLPDSFRLIFHDSPLGVAVVLNTGDATLDNAMLLYANPALLELIRHKSPDNYDFVSVIREFCDDEEGRSLLPLAQDPSEMQSIYVRIKPSEDRTIWVEVRAQPTTILGERAHFFWFTDVTETKEQETIARREAAKADAAAQAKAAFLATMSHEIRTPMQTIFGMLELMKDESSPDNLLTMIGSAQNSANGLLGILDDILDLAKVDAGKMELDAFEVPLANMVLSLVQSMESKRRENNLFLKSDIADDVPNIIIGDPKRLRQILTNLLSNGIKFTEQGGVTIRITTQTRHISVPEDRTGLRFEIIDTGIGMSHETASRLFQPFTQADNSTTRKFGGTGLGLSIAHRLVELMGGQIGVNSEIGKGSTFWFEIPGLKSTQHQVVELPDLTGLNILFADPNNATRTELAAHLQYMKADVTAVGSMSDAVSMAEKRPYDVALIDHDLNDANSLALLKQLRDTRPFMGLVFYTVQTDYAVLQACKFAGAKHVEKPASHAVLGEAIKGAAKRVRTDHLTRPQKLLICEDNESVRDIIQRQLAKLNVPADFAEDGQAGWDIIQRGEHTVIITDLHMPRMDGYGLVKAVRGMEQDKNVQADDRLPLIAMTADVQLVHEHVYLEHGFDECLLKPVSIGQLKQLLIRWGVIREDEDVAPAQHADVPPPAPVAETVAEPVVDAQPEPQPDPPSQPVVVPADVELPRQPVIDKDMAVQQFGAFDDDAVMMIKMFIQISTPQVAQMREMHKNGDWIGIKNAAHSLKGAARSACCMQLGDVAEDIQKSGAMSNVTPFQMQQLDAAFAKACDAVAAL